MNKNKLFNTDIETSIRLLTLIVKIDGNADLQKLIYMDFLALHYGDIDHRVESLHVANPYHVTEVYSRRELIKSSIDILLRKGLVDLHMSYEGIEYSKNNLSKSFLELFDSDYFMELEANVELVTTKFNGYSTSELKTYFDQNIHSWEDEFIYEVAFRGGDIDE